MEKIYKKEILRGDIKPKLNEIVFGIVKKSGLKILMCLKKDGRFLSTTANYYSWHEVFFLHETKCKTETNIIYSDESKCNDCYFKNKTTPEYFV